MRKFRSWLLGLGIGLIIGASMLQLIQLAQDQAVMVEEVSFTREQLNEEAKKAGLLLLSEEQLATKVKDAVATARKEESPKTPDKTPIPPTPSKKPEPSASPEPKRVTLAVTYGMTLTEAAYELKKLGVIEDAEDFIHKAGPISKKMSIGKSVFIGKPTYKQIMAELKREK